VEKVLAWKIVAECCFRTFPTARQIPSSPGMTACLGCTTEQSRLYDHSNSFSCSDPGDGAGIDGARPSFPVQEADPSMKGHTM